MKFNKDLSKNWMLANEICDGIREIQRLERLTYGYWDTNPHDDHNPYSMRLAQARKVRPAHDGCHKYLELGKFTESQKSSCELIGWITLGDETNYYEEYIYGEREQYFVVVDIIDKTIKVFSK